MPRFARILPSILDFYSLDSCFWSWFILVAGEFASSISVSLADDEPSYLYFLLLAFFFFFFDCSVRPNCVSNLEPVP